MVLKMLKKKLGIEAIERNWNFFGTTIVGYYKIPLTLIIPKGCEKIGEAVFRHCWRLKKVIIPENVEVIENFAFSHCMRATIILEKPESEFKKIGYASFSGCYNATIILKKHKKNFKSIFNNSFADCKVVKKIKEGAGIL